MAPQPFSIARDKRASIVENLGDREIVKHAFKVFGHNLNITEINQCSKEKILLEYVGGKSSKKFVFFWSNKM